MCLSRARLHIKTAVTGVRISIKYVRRWRDRLIFIIGIPILVRHHLYSETDPILLTPRLVMTWWRKEPGHQLLWYWTILPRMPPSAQEGSSLVSMDNISMSHNRIIDKKRAKMGCFPICYLISCEYIISQWEKTLRWWLRNMFKWSDKNIEGENGWYRILDTESYNVWRERMILTLAKLPRRNQNINWRRHQMNTAECRHKGAQYSKTLPQLLRELGQDVNQRLDPQKHSIPNPNGRAFVNICEKIDHLLTAPHCICDCIYCAVFLNNVL